MMKRVVLLIMALAIGSQSPAPAAPGDPAGVNEVGSARLLLRPMPTLAQLSGPVTPPSGPLFASMSQLGSEETARRKSPKLAALFSAIVPGSGEMYAGSFLKGAIFLGVEAGAWIGYSKFHQKGVDLRSEYQDFADANWVADDYWSWLANEPDCPCGDQDAACLKDYERSRFSHHLPDEKNHEYYENIGKYDQFDAGWVDAEGLPDLQRDSALREEYTLMRRDSNNQFQKATNMTALVLVNHVLSALDAAWTSRRHNRSLQASLRVVPVRYRLEAIPTLQMRVGW